VERVVQGGLWSGNRDQYTKTCGKDEAVIESTGSGQQLGQLGTNLTTVVWIGKAG
jgi:hypothetical protein